MNMDVLKPLISSKLLTSSAAREILSSVVLSSVGRPLDLLYSRLGGINGRFFPTGWGNLGVVNLQEDIDLIKDWPPQGIKVSDLLLTCCCSLFVGLLDCIPKRSCELSPFLSYITSSYMCAVHASLHNIKMGPDVVQVRWA